MKEIVIATKNKGKITEYQGLFEPFNVKVKSLYDLDQTIDIEETGTTFEENALIKANAIKDLYNIPVLADDSGLVVDALNGEPGIYSARYAGLNKDDQANNRKLLKALENVPQKDRSAHFVCALALVIPGKEDLVVEGKLNGFISAEQKGVGGFGYDPIFYIPELDKHAAELSREEKSAISHRGNAIRKLESKLSEMMDEK